MTRHDRVGTVYGVFTEAQRLDKTISVTLGLTGYIPAPRFNAELTNN
jgi:hypothetical protein